MPIRPDIDEYTLLCERCGYVIEGLPKEGECPECGKPIAESLPERRVGTPWQQNPTAESLVATWWMSLRHPKRTLDVMMIDRTSTRALQRRSLSIVILPGPMLFLMLVVGGHTWLPAWFMVLVSVALPVGMYLLFAMLTNIESSGLQLLGRTRSARMTKEVSQAVTAHGATGWVLMTIGLSTSFIIGIIAAAFGVRPIPHGEGEFAYYAFGMNYLGDVLLHLAGYLFLAACLAGFLFFEWFAWLGLRRCKYANRTRPDG